MKNLLLTLLLLASLPILAQVDTAKIMHYNLLSFGQPCGSININDKYDWLGVILEHEKPDVLTVNEMGPNAVLANGIVQLSFDYTNLISQGDLTNDANSNFANQIFFRTDKFGYKGVDVIGGAIRDINVYKLYYLPSAQPGSDTVFLNCIVAHFKAGDATSDKSQRNNAANSITNYIAQNGTNENYLLLGDLNIGGASETAFQNLINPTDPATRFFDPINKQAGWAGPSNAIYHTQSARNSTVDCGAGGGMDDRFDFILANEAIMNGSLGVSYVDGSYHAMGNDGSSYNDELNCFSNSSVPSNVCTRLRLMSDHLPVVAEFAFSLKVGVRDELIPDLTVKVAPHPFGEQLNLRLEEENTTPASYRLELWDVLGRMVRKQEVRGSDAIKWDTSELTGGAYILRIVDEKGRSLRRKVWKRR